MTDKYQKLCAEARARYGLKPDLDEVQICLDCPVLAECEV